MKRDMDLIRKMVLAVEDFPHGYAPDDLKIAGDYTDEQIGYHSYLLADGGLVKGLITTTWGAPAPTRTSSI